MLVSIVIPIYNSAPNILKKCFDSVVNQTYKNIEIIIVSDGAVTSNNEIAESYCKKDRRIKIIYQKNSGPGSARNKGIKKCCGNYIMFVDSDDWIELDAVEKSVYEIEHSNKPDILLFGAIREYSNKSEPFGYEKYISTKVYKKSEINELVKDLLSENAKIEGPVAKLYNKSFLDKNKLLFNEKTRIAEDLEFNLRCFSISTEIIVMKDLLYHYFCNTNSLTNKTDYSSIESGLYNFKMMDQYIKKTNNLDLLSIFNDRVLCFIVTSFISGFFNPENLDKYKTKKRRASEFKNDVFVNEKINNDNNLSFERKIIIWLIKNNFYFLINIFSLIRFYQKRIK